MNMKPLIDVKSKVGYSFVHRIPSEYGEPVAMTQTGDHLLIATNTGFLLSISMIDSTMAIVHFQVKDV